MRSLTTTATLDQPSWNLIHQLVRQLEDGWRQGTPLSLDQFPLPLSGRSRERLLVELIKVDQDYRFQAGESRLLESYLGEWPELATQHDAVVELLTAECVTRAAHQALPTREDLAARFPDHADAIDLSALEAETRALSDTSHADPNTTSPGFEPLPREFQAAGKVFGRYEIRSVLGRGGMGSVYRANDTQLGREVALKVPRFDVIADPVVRERFVREARLAASVRHPNVCPIYDVGEINGTFYISMSLVEGESLSAMLARGPLPTMQAAEIVRKLANALTRIHEAGVIHRDIKPSNILIDESGEPLLMDFGLARPTQPAADQLITTAGSLLGTPIFMSPEQVAGDSAAVDARTDIYSLGVVLYQSLTGKLPFSGSLTDVLVQIAHADPLKPRSIRSDLDARLEAIVLKAIARRCEDRYQTARELAVALEEWLRRQERLLDTQAIALPASDVVMAARWKRMRAWLTTVALMTVVALAAVVIYVKTDKGTLEIAGDDDEVSVVVEQAGKLVTVINKKSGKQILLPSGDYQLKLGDGADDLELIASEITLKRGKTTVATIRRISDRIAAAKTEDAPKTEDQASPRSVAATKVSRPADREKPFAVLSVEGKSRGEFRHFSEAIAAIEAGDTIEVHGNGPFELGHVRVDHKGLTIRAAPGYRPVFVPGPAANVQGWWFEVASALTVEGCDFRSPTSIGLLTSTSASDVTWELRNCQFLGDFTLAKFFGKKLRIEDCLIASTRGLIGYVGKDAELEVMNNLVWCVGGFGLAGPGGQTVRLQHNTFVQTGAPGATLLGYAATSGMEPPSRPITVEASGNLFAVPWSVVNRMSGYADWLGELRWQGRDNLYVGPRALVINEPGDGPVASSSLAEWFRRWGEEPGSQHVPRALFQWDQPSTESAEKAVTEFKSILAQLHREHSQAPEELGPNWDVVGPGPAYVRSLEASGQPADMLARREPSSGGPFVVWRNARVVRAVAKLQDAIDAAASGDTIIVHSDGEIPSVAYDTTKRLHLRAAPGFRPTLDGPLGGVNTIEGFQFRKPLVAFGTDRFVNCSFDEGLIVGDSPAFAGDPKQPLEIVNCLIAGAVQFQLLPNRKLTVQNSVVGAFVTKYSGEHVHSLELDRCVVWRPGPLNWNEQFLPSGITNFAHNPLAVTARNTLFETGISLLWNDDTAATVTWKGSRNVYRVGGNWQFQNDTVVGLDAWRRRFNSEELDSVQADPLHYDPLQWRLLPSSPGYRAGPDGRDLGADVERQRHTSPSDKGQPSPESSPILPNKRDQ